MSGVERPYFSVFTKGGGGVGFSRMFGSTTSDAVSLNPFKRDSYSADATAGGFLPIDVNTTINSVSDGISFSETTGLATVQQAGSYFFCFSCRIALPAGSVQAHAFYGAVALINGGSSAGGTTHTLNVFIGGPPPTSGNDKTVTANKIIDLNAGDTIEFQATHGAIGATPTSGLSALEGCFATMFKLNGIFSHARYTGPSSTINAAGNVTLYDQSGAGSHGGSFESSVNGVTYTTSNGTFIPSANRIFLYFSTWSFRTNTPDTANNIDHKLCRDGSSLQLQEIKAGTHDDDLSRTNTYFILKQVDSDENASIKREMDTTDDFIFGAGTAFSFIDISNNGTLPTAFFACNVNSDSPAIDGTINIWSQTERGDTYTLETPLDGNLGTNTGITLNQVNGRFTVENSGAYLILSAMQIDTSTDSGTTGHRIHINGSEEPYYITGVYHDTDQDPKGNAVALILHLNAGDFFEIKAFDLDGDVNDGTALVAIKLDQNIINTGKDTIFNSSDLSVMNPYDNATQYLLNLTPASRATRQAPFILGARGYGVTRENDTAIVVDPGDKSNTDD